MSFTTSWHNLLDNVEGVADDATLFTPLSGKPFRVTDVQEHRVVIEFEDEDETRPLQRDQFETLFRRVTDTHEGFDLDRLPPDAEPYATVLSLHPRFELDDNEGTLAEIARCTVTKLVFHSLVRLMSGIITLKPVINLLRVDVNEYRSTVRAGPWIFTFIESR